MLFFESQNTLLWVGLFVVDETWRIARDGGTAAHRREGLAVVDEQTGEPPGTRQALARVALATARAGLPAYITISNKAEGCAPLSVAALVQELVGTEKA